MEDESRQLYTLQLAYLSLPSAYVEMTSFLGEVDPITGDPRMVITKSRVPLPHCYFLSVWNKKMGEWKFSGLMAYVARRKLQHVDDRLGVLPFPNVMEGGSVCMGYSQEFDVDSATEAVWKLESKKAILSFIGSRFTVDYLDDHEASGRTPDVLRVHKTVGASKFFVNLEEVTSRIGVEGIRNLPWVDEKSVLGLFM